MSDKEKQLLIGGWKEEFVSNI